MYRHVVTMSKDIKPVSTVNARDNDLAKRSSQSQIGAFLAAARSVKPSGDGTGRIILALDATMSRQPTWDLASSIQGQMFSAVSKSARLNMQLVYFRGFGECRASRFVSDGHKLAAIMSGVDCRAGQTQIGKVLKHALKEQAKAKVSAIVFIGDAVEEDADALGHLAGQLGLKGLPVFVFQEGRDAHAKSVLKEIARLSKGGWFAFDRNAPSVLADLLSSIAVYATGGLKALSARGSESDRVLLEQLKPGGGK